MNTLLVVGFCFYMLGIATGAVGMVTLTLYFANRARAKMKSLSSVTDRMKKVKELTNEQLDLSSAGDGPQKNALHGKHKNGIFGRMKEIEQEKNKILRSILDDGHDPVITTIDESGVVTQLKLSEYMTHSEPKQSKVEKITTSKTDRLSKFSIVKGGKDDEDESNPTH